MSVFGEIDLYLAGEGRHERLYDVLGAHVRDAGVSFAVWAPNARAVAVVGDFNDWQPTALTKLGDSGIWEVLVEGAQAGGLALGGTVGTVFVVVRRQRLGEDVLADALLA